MVAPSCGEATTAEQCAAAVSELIDVPCNWFDIHALDVGGGTCELTPVAGQGVCLEPAQGDTICGQGDTCDWANVYYRLLDDGTTELIRSGSGCTSYGPGSDWTHCPPLDDGGGSSTGNAGSTGASTDGAPPPGPCECGCSELP